MSFFDEIKTEIQTEQNQKSNLAEQASAAQASQAASEPAPTAPVLPERMSEFVQEELKTLQGIIRQDARSGKYQTVGGKHLFDGNASFSVTATRYAIRFPKTAPFISIILEKK